MADKYRSFEELAAHEKLGEDYEFEARRKADSQVAIIAPHGGRIEPTTDAIADAIAGKDFSFYGFRGLKNGSDLHITSHRFNEPTCEELIRNHETVIAIHGWGAAGERLCIGGRDSELAEKLKTALTDAGFKVDAPEGGLAGADPQNIVNRGASGKGVQVELTMGLRRNREAAKKFTDVVRAVLLETQTKKP